MVNGRKYNAIYPAYYRLTLTVGQLSKVVSQEAHHFGVQCPIPSCSWGGLASAKQPSSAKFQGCWQTTCTNGPSSFSLKLLLVMMPTTNPSCSPHSAECNSLCHCSVSSPCLHRLLFHGIYRRILSKQNLWSDIGLVLILRQRVWFGAACMHF